MNKFLVGFAVVLLVIVASVNALRPIKFAPSAPSRALPANILAFVEGFALGIEADVGNVTLCTQDATITLNDFENAFYSLENGIKRLSPKLIETGLKEFGAGVQELAVALKGCNVNGIVAKIEEIAKELQSGPGGIVKVIVHEIVNIFHNSRDISGEFKKAISFWKQQKWELCGVQVGKIVGVLLE